MLYLCLLERHLYKGAYSCVLWRVNNNLYRPFKDTCTGRCFCIYCSFLWSISNHCIGHSRMLVSGHSKKKCAQGPHSTCAYRDKCCAQVFQVKKRPKTRYCGQYFSRLECMGSLSDLTGPHAYYMGSEDEDSEGARRAAMLCYLSYSVGIMGICSLPLS